MAAKKARRALKSNGNGVNLGFAATMCLAADGHDGFWGRWLQYAQAAHGGNVALKSRDPSNYQVSILEVAGTAASTEDILQMEFRWKDKLQCREMGLNRN